MNATNEPSLIEQIMHGRPGEAELRARFRASQQAGRQPLTEDACDHVTVSPGHVRIVRPAAPQRPVGRVLANGWATFDV